MKKFYAVVISLFVYCSAFSQTTLYVDSSRATSGAGTSWATAYKELREAIATANGQSGTVQILVAKGTYKPTATNNRDTSFALLRGGLKLYGGYSSGGGTRNAAAYPTVLSGDIGTVNNNADNSYHVIVIAGIPASADSLTIEGFAVTRGNADGATYKTYNGQGINRNFGGGIALQRSYNKVFLRNCVLSGNSAEWGGGMFMFGSSSAITNCTVSGNNARDYGGGTFIYNSSPIVTNCIFFGNSSSYGGGVRIDDGFPAFVNCTFSANSAQNTGGVMFVVSGFLAITNCIIWGNTATSYDAFTTVGVNRITVTYSLVQDGYAGNGNLSVDPKFVDAADPEGPDNLPRTADDGLRLQINSPSINKGRSDSIPDGITTDITGAARIQGSAVDMGAYESLVTSFTTLYVDSSITTPGGGGTWATAYKELRDAVAAAAANSGVNTILVAKGTYKPTADANRDTSFALLRGGLKLYGGYPSGGGIRNVTSYPTILSGDIGVANDSTDNSYHVLVVAGIVATADSLVVDGFTITRGNANGSGAKFYNAELIDRSEGGGIVIKRSNSSKVSLRICIFSGNTAQSNGGGMYMYGSSSTIANCTFSGNKAQSGGGMEINNNSSPAFINCTFSGNNAQSGGGMYIVYNSSPSITNCTFSGNRAELYGGGMEINNNCSPILTNCTIVGNSASNGGGGMDMDDGSPVITNCIVWGNTAPAGNSIRVNTSTPKVTYSLVQGGYTGAGNLNTDPLFVNAADTDGPDNLPRTADDGLRLQTNSLAVNKGRNDSIPDGITTDITGAARIREAIADMGAYELQNNLTKLYVDSSIVSGGNGGTWATAYKELRDALTEAILNPGVDSILVAEGTYKPTNTANRDFSFSLNRGNIKLYGGYPTGGGVRNSGANQTILSGDIGTVNNSANNSYHVMVLSNIAAANDSLVIDGFTFTKGNADGPGTTVYNGQSVNQNAGAGLTALLVDNKTAIRNCIFTANTSSGNGGAVYSLSSSPAFSNSLFFSNKGSVGGAIFSYEGAPAFLHCTVAGNQGSFAGPGFYGNGGSPVITNSLFWGNTPSNINPISLIAISSPSITNTLIERGFPGSGNIAQDPVFVNAANPAGTDGIYGTTDDGLRLQQCSPAINSGSLAVTTTGTDISGFTRVFNSLPDMGAYEYRAIGEGNSLGINGDDSTYIIRTGVMPLLEKGCRIIARVTANGASPINGTLTSRLWVDAALPSYNGQNFVKRHFQLTPSGGSTAMLTLYATQQEFNDFNAAATLDLPTSPADADGIARLSIYKFSGESSNGSGLPASYTGTPLVINPDDAQVVWNVTQQRWQITFNVTDFSGFFIGTASGSVLPLTLLDFTAHALTGTTVLNWRTTDEINTKEFEIESNNNGGNNWQVIGKATARGQGAGNYTFKDLTPYIGKNYYRLKMIDRDSRFTYSPVRLVDRDNTANKMFSLSPNPASRYVNLNFHTVLATPVVRIFDAMGKTFGQYKLTINTNSFRLNIDHLPSGTYTIAISSGDKVAYEKLLVIK